MGFLADHGIKAICLDIDGTLYPPRMLNVRMLRSLFPSPLLGLAFNKVRQKYRVLQEERDTVPANREGLLTRQATLMLHHFGKEVTEESIEKMRLRIERQFYSSWRRSFRTIKPFGHMQKALQMAKKEGVQVVAFSDFPVEQKLETLGIASLVDIGLSAEDSGYLKPSPHAFAYLLDHVQADPSEILFVGDSYEKDCQGAKRAGMYSALITGSKRAYPEADLVVGSWKEFISLLF